MNEEKRRKGKVLWKREMSMYGLPINIINNTTNVVGENIISVIIIPVDDTQQPTFSGTTVK